MMYDYWSDLYDGLVEFLRRAGLIILGVLLMPVFLLWVYSKDEGVFEGEGCRICGREKPWGFNLCDSCRATAIEDKRWYARG